MHLSYIRNFSSRSIVSRIHTAGCKGVKTAQNHSPLGPKLATDLFLSRKTLAHLCVNLLISQTHTQVTFFHVSMAPMRRMEKEREERYSHIHIHTCTCIASFFHSNCIHSHSNYWLGWNSLATFYSRGAFFLYASHFFYASQTSLSLALSFVHLHLPFPSYS